MRDDKQTSVTHEFLVNLLEDLSSVRDAVVGNPLISILLAPFVIFIFLMICYLLAMASYLMVGGGQ